MWCLVANCQIYILHFILNPFFDLKIMKEDNVDSISE